ncbi:hypothetical protein [Sphingosinicella terrae]|uniref:hypothetical protein n=1 Tax=Sphingosinicella terrae TaxID=2172047 RepID=UPI0013B3817D|nr:hypothetical protein [Sphingosinicella terrae]
MEKTAIAALLGIAAMIGGCASEAQDQADAPASNRVETSGKSDVPLAEVPAEVLAAAQAAQAGFVPAEAERETREGRLYYDVEGRLADGSEIEFDIMQDGAAWRVVETQRDIAFAAAPSPVREAASAHVPGLEPTRVIESVQPDGVVIYEIYAPDGADPQGRKVEVRWNGREADLLTQEWAH